MRTNLSDLCEQRTSTTWTARQISSIQPQSLSACYTGQHISNSYLQTGSTLTSPQKSQTRTQVVATNQRSSLNFFVYHPPYASNCSSAQLLYQSCWLINNSVWRVNVWWAELLWSSTNEWWPCRLAENDCFDRDKEADGTRTADTDWHTPETCTLICFVQHRWSAQYMVGAHLHLFSIKMLLAIKM